jgi:acyl-CoA thioesterase-1
MSGKGRAVSRLRAAVALLLALGVGVFAGWNLGAPSSRTGSAAAPPSPGPGGSSGVLRTIAGPQRRVVLFGDGMIDGYGLPDDRSLPMLLAKARPDLLLVDLGLGHETSAQLGARVRDATQPRPDAVVLWTGSYDSASGIGAQQYAGNVGALLDSLKGIRVVLLPPLSLPNGPDVSAYAVELDRVAAQHGVSVLDASSALSAPDWLDSGQELGPRTDAALAALLAKAL